MGKNHETILRELHLKITPKRLAVLAILSEERQYAGPDEIWMKMKEKFSNIGLPTVYRILEELSEGEVISKIIHPDRKLYYYYCGNSRHHHHFICLSCHRVEDVNVCISDKIQREVTANLRGKVHSHILQINGFCSACSTEGGK